MIKKPKANVRCLCCDDPFLRLDGQNTRFCGLEACYAEGIRAFWRKLGYEATVKYEDGHPRLVGVPVRL